MISLMLKNNPNINETNLLLLKDYELLKKLNKFLLKAGVKFTHQLQNMVSQIHSKSGQNIDYFS